MDTNKNTTKKLALVAIIVLAAFFASYGFAMAKRGANDTRQTVPTSPATVSAPADTVAQAGSAGDGCCGGGSAPVEGATTLTSDVQTLTIDTASGSFNPNVIKVKASVPVELTFTQAPGGCMSGVVFPDFDINEDLTGGQKTVKLPALEPGEYTFFCQMQMVTGTLVVE